ncbi:MAG: tetratricopeptide repeat protein [Gemmatimonadetes bacterium]|nr:MAG: tetratricopeptide repeat protein [Gemmatimonadota bacterium]
MQCRILASLFIVSFLLVVVSTAHADSYEEQMMWYRTGQQYQQGKQYYGLKKYDQAIPYLELAIDIADSLPHPNEMQQKFKIQARQELAHCYQETGKFDLAAKLFGEAVQLENPPNIDHYFNVVVAYRKAGDADKMLKFADEVLKMDSTYTRAILAKGEAYEMKKDIRKAMGYYRKVYDMGDKEGLVRLENMGTEFHNKKDWANSEMVHRYILEIDPENTAAIAKIGAAYAEQEDYDMAYEYLVKVKDAKGKWGKYAKDLIKQIDKARAAAE